MFAGLFMLLSLSTLMAIASFLAGLLPLSLSLSQKQLRIISTLGMGVLVGTSLVVIIPEGIDTLYNANAASSPAKVRRSLEGAGLDVRWSTPPPRTSFDWLPLTRRAAEGADSDKPNGSPPPGWLEAIGSQNGHDPPKTPTEPGVVGALSEPAPPNPPEKISPPKTPEEPPHSARRNLHVWVGVSLILGFILMYLIDTLPSLAPPPTPTRNNIYSLAELSSSPSSPPASSSDKSAFSTTLGLVIHAAADGIALGASATQPALSFVVFFAIMVHKAPAAFGLTTVLLRQGLGKRQARTHLIAFSAAAPAGALCTWIVVRILGGGGSGSHSMGWWTGVILLFSGGTFLYVAMHTMQESDGHSGSDESQSNGYLDVQHARDSMRQKPQKSPELVMAAVAGMLLPLVTQIGHAH